MVISKLIITHGFFQVPLDGSHATSGLVSLQKDKNSNQQSGEGGGVRGRERGERFYYFDSHQPCRLQLASSHPRYCPGAPSSSCLDDEECGEQWPSPCE